MLHEHLNISGRCDDELRNTIRTRLRGVAEAGQYISVAIVAATCRETISVIEEVARKSANRMGVLFLSNLQSMGRVVQDTSSAWGKVFVEVGAMESMNIFMIRGMRGKESRASLDVTMNGLENLQLLQIADTDWREPIPTKVSRLTQLRDLRLSEHSRLVRLPKGLLDQLGALTQLSLSRNRLTVLQKLDKNTALEYLNLAANQLAALPNLDNNIALEYLYAEDNQLTELPRLDKNIVLKHLSVGGNQLTALPSLDDNTALEILYLDTNQLTELPRLDKNIVLKHLSVGGNQLTALPSLDDNTALEILYLDTNQLFELPRLDNNIALKHLSVGGNQLTAMPSLESTALEYLTFSNNRLSTWSAQGGLPSSLKFIGVANNMNLDTIPFWVLQLPKLEYLDCSGNNITTLTNVGEIRSNTVDSDVLGRNTSLLLLGGNPVCGTMSSGNREDTGLMWGSRWNVQCRSQCSSTCEMSIPWNTMRSWLGDGLCDAGCNSTACGYDGGDCLLELR